MSDGARHQLVRAFLLGAMLSAGGLMISSVVGDAQARMMWQAASLIACLGSGGVWMLLVQRWWPGHHTVRSLGTRRHRPWW
ncbi:MAG: hypothetical protein QOK35_1065 [Pseudonocardiales bacterium]|nr:hypothetical protein [Pseudonocardiales bacterium]